MSLRCKFGWHRWGGSPEIGTTFVFEKSENERHFHENFYLKCIRCNKERIQYVEISKKVIKK